MNGEYTVMFDSLPLNISLVHSSQSYGSWEVSDVLVNSEPIEPEDVIIAINGNKANALLDTEDFLKLFKVIEFPITIRFRKPKCYLKADSHSTATALFPASNYHPLGQEDRHSKAWKTRASSEQWKFISKRDFHSNNTANSVRDISDFHPTSPLFSNLRKFFNRKENRDDEDNTPVKINEKGEYDYIFREKPLSIVVAPSTRMYGTIEILHVDKTIKAIAPGDVIMAFNGDFSAARWSMLDFQESCNLKHCPIELRLRKPWMYSLYLNRFLPKEKDSESTSRAMFPNSAEYRKNLSFSKQLHRHPIRKTKIPEKTKLEEWKKQVQEERQEKEKQEKMFQDSIGKTSKILSNGNMQFLINHLSESLGCCEVIRLYSSREDGFNLTTFYRKLQNKGPSLLVIKDYNDYIFGVFASSSWKHSNETFGNGTTFLFQLEPQQKIYHWNSKNDDFLFGGKEFLVVGGGEGAAICLEEDLTRGFSHSCDTFDSPQLTKEQAFTCDTIEVWGFAGIKL